jgi:hypothetical protein
MPRSPCNFHTWLVAKVGEAGAAAEAMLRMLEHPFKEGSARADCSLCAWIVLEEEKKLAEFAQDLYKPELLQRLRERGGLCIPHGRTLFNRVPNGLPDEIILALQRQAVELRRELVTLSRNAKDGITTHAGLLGRTAECLVANRGLDIKP